MDVQNKLKFIIVSLLNSFGIVNTTVHYAYIPLGLGKGIDIISYRIYKREAFRFQKASMQQKRCTLPEGGHL